MKGNIRKGEKGTGVVFYKKLSKTKSLNLEDEVTVEDQSFWVLRTYTVFNIDQVEGLDHLKPKIEPVEPFQALEEAEGLLVDSGAEILHAPIDEAFYDRKRDFITFPVKESFESREAYYGTALHELIQLDGTPNPPESGIRVALRGSSLRLRGTCR